MWLHMLVIVQIVEQLSVSNAESLQASITINVCRETLAVKNVGEFGEWLWIRQIYSSQILSS